MRRRTRSRLVDKIPEVSTQSMLASWMIKLILRHGWIFRGLYCSKEGYRDHDVANFLNLLEIEDEADTVETVKQQLATNLARFEATIDHDKTFMRNIDLLSNRLELSDLQQKILYFSLITNHSEYWRDLFRYIKIENETKFINIIATALDEPYTNVKNALCKKGFLHRSGILGLNKDDYDDAKLSLSSVMEEALSADNENENELFRHFLQKAAPATLSAKDFHYMRDELDIVFRIITGSLSTGQLGTNILIYGVPGTGKTEVSRLIGQRLGLATYEVQTEDSDGDFIASKHRLESFRLSQRLLSGDSRSLLLFDEIEDVFPNRASAMFGREITSGENKGWINRALEENTTPTIWISNQIGQIDPAFLRRFDYILELKTAPINVRSKIAKSYLGHTGASKELISRIAAHEDLSSAQLAKVSKVAASMNCGLDEGNIDNAIESVVNSNLIAMNFKPLTKISSSELKYDATYLNTNVDISKLVTGLARTGTGSLCFYGAPGTGKTALAAHIANVLDKPLISRKISDITSMWVGATEKNIAKMFDQASTDDAILVLDEADSLLRDRRYANNSWEVTQVNELLVQMENFEGVFICSTNLMDDIDQASLRRFAIKVEFGWLSTDQTVRMLKRECVGRVSAAQQRAISTLTNLGPGDFAAVKKRLDILGVRPTADTMVKELGIEVGLKDGPVGRHVGF